MKNAHIPKMNNDNSIVFEDETYGGVFEDPDQVEEQKTSTNPKKVADKNHKSASVGEKKLNQTADNSAEDSVNVSRTGQSKAQPSSSKP